MSKYLWEQFVLHYNIDNRVEPNLIFDKPYFQYKIPNMLFTHYEASINNDGFLISLDIEHEILIKHYTNYFNILSSIFPYNILQTKNRMALSKQVSFHNIELELNKLIDLTLDKIKQIYANLSSKKLSTAFDRIYQDNIWGYGSGTGSDANLNRPYIDFLNEFISRNNIKSIVDCGSGDWQYMRYINLDNVKYNGYDVSEKIINLCRATYGSDNIQFHCYDGDFSQLPSADLVICKEVLQHLPNSYIYKFIKILHKYKYAMICNSESYIAEENNAADIEAGGGRPLAINLPPFSLNATPILDIPRGKHVLRFYLFSSEHI